MSTLSKHLTAWAKDRPGPVMMSIFISRAESLEGLLQELLSTLEPTYSASPEGRQYLENCKLVLGWNQPETPPNAGECLHKAIEKAK